MKSLVRRLLRVGFNYDPSFCDMHEDGHARQAAQEYLRHLRPAIRQHVGTQPLLMLDAGCQAGRLLIPLAEDGHRLIGIDTSGFALRLAAAHARARNLRVRLHRGNIARVRRWVKPQSLDVVICTEVLYLCRDHRALLALLVESVRPGGLICVSHRPLAHYLASAVRHGRPELIPGLVRRGEGPSPDGEYHNWQTPQELEALYATLGLTILGCHPVDYYAEHAVDFDAIRDPAARAMLESMRTGADSKVRVPGYLLVIAQRPSPPVSGTAGA